MPVASPAHGPIPKSEMICCQQQSGHPSPPLSQHFRVESQQPHPHHRRRPYYVPPLPMQSQHQHPHDHVPPVAYLNLNYPHCMIPCPDPADHRDPSSPPPLHRRVSAYSRAPAQRHRRWLPAPDHHVPVPPRPRPRSPRSPRPYRPQPPHAPAMHRVARGLLSPRPRRPKPLYAPVTAILYLNYRLMADKRDPSSLHRRVSGPRSHDPAQQP